MIAPLTARAAIFVRAARGPEEAPVLVAHLCLGKPAQEGSATGGNGRRGLLVADTPLSKARAHRVFSAIIAAVHGHDGHERRRSYARP